MTTQTLRAKQKAPRPASIVINGSVWLPSWITADHASFRRWACSNEFPERGQFFHLGGELWVDLSMETLIHNQIKAAISIVIHSLVLAEGLGRFLFDRMMLTHIAAGLSCEPDGMFISNEALDFARVSLAEGDQSLEIVGSPDMTLEVVSKTSGPKDKTKLMDLYAKAGIAEYWLVDSTLDHPELVIMRLAGGKYVSARKQDGWVKSHVFGRSFRLTFRKDANGLSQVKLETK